MINPNGVVLGVFETAATYLKVEAGHLRVFAVLLGLCFLINWLPKLVLALFILATLYVLAAMATTRIAAERRTSGLRRDHTSASD